MTKRLHGVTVRTMEEDDLQACLSMWAEGKDADAAARARHLLAQRPRLSVVAETPTGVIGWALVSFNGFSAYVQRIHVGSADRDDGVGRAILTGIEDRARRVGAAKVALVSAEDTVGFYEHLGYAVTRSRYGYKTLAPSGRAAVSANFDLGEAVRVLRSTPDTLRSMLGSLPDAWLASIPAGEEWSPVDTVGHLISGEETDWMVRVEHLLRYGQSRAFEPFIREAMRDDAPGPGDMSELLGRFAALRMANLDRLKSLGLGVNDMQKMGHHPSFGDVSLGELLSTWAVHDLSHIAQLSRVLAARYRNAVGPWRSYLAILDR
jgi:ribosomal protein S18 acetylase RimI-like enzyme